MIINLFCVMFGIYLVKNFLVFNFIVLQCVQFLVVYKSVNLVLG